MFWLSASSFVPSIVAVVAGSIAASVARLVIFCFIHIKFIDDFTLLY